MTKRTLICIDDEPQILKALERSLRRESYDLFTTTSAQEAFQKIQDTHAQVVISDYRMQEMTGLDVLKRVKEIQPKAVRVILSGYADETLIKDALQNGDVQDYLFKPWDIEKLKVQIEHYFNLSSASEVK